MFPFCSPSPDVWAASQAALVSACNLQGATSIRFPVQIEEEGETRSWGDAAATARWRTPATDGEEKRSATAAFRWPKPTTSSMRRRRCRSPSRQLIFLTSWVSGRRPAVAGSGGCGREQAPTVLGRGRRRIGEKEEVGIGSRERKGIGWE